MEWKMVVSDGEKKEKEIRTWGGDAWHYGVTI